MSTKHPLPLFLVAALAWAAPVPAQPGSQAPARDVTTPIQPPAQDAPSTATAREASAQAGDAAQDPLRQAVAKALKVRERLLQPMYVNGVEVSPLEIQRQVLYRVGQRQMMEKMIEMIIDEQMEAAIKEGRKKRADFDVLEQEVEKNISDAKAEFLKKYPDKDIYEILAMQSITPEEFRTMTRTTLLFDKIFFPGAPKDWPDITKECIIAAGGQQGVEFMQKLEESVKGGQQMPPFFLQICRQWVRTSLEKWGDVKYASDGLPPDICFSYNGQEWKTADAARVLGLKMKPQDYEKALVAVALRVAVQNELEKAGAWLDDEEFKKAFDEYQAPYKDSPFNIKMLALTFKGYPSFEVYKTRWRLEKSYERMIEDEINDDALKAHLERAALFLNDAKVSVHLIRIPAWDDERGTWQEDGWARAKQEAEGIMDAIATGKAPFEEFMQTRSKWPAHIEHRGFLGMKSLNELRQELRESDFTDFISGYSVANELFYNGKEGNVVGPLRGQDAYYIGFVAQRAEPGGRISLDNKDQRDLIKQDYLSTRFLTWANQVAARTSIR
ncbi:MAG: hypothetical protein R3F30_12285 [Planctomycetota bacterium]